MEKGLLLFVWTGMFSPSVLEKSSPTTVASISMQSESSLHP